MRFLCCVLLVCLLGAARASSAQGAAGSPSGQRALLDKYCVTCHNQRLRTAGLLLDQADVTSVPAAAEIWEKVIRKVRAGAMPPAGAPRPDRKSADGLVTWLTSTLDAAAAAQPNPGRTAIHRLNRVEYANAVRDVLGVDVDAAALLPPDDAGYGFDNIGDVLTITPGLLERYLLAARKIARTAIGDETLRPSSEKYGVPFALVQDVRMNEDLPFGTRGGLTARHTFPVDGEYEISIELQRHSLALGSRIRGLNDQNIIDVLLDGELVRRFTVGKQGDLITGERRGINEQFTAGGNAAASGRGTAGDVVLAARLPVRAGTHLVAVTFVDTPWYMEGVGVSRLPAASDGYSAGTDSAQNFGKIQMGVDHISVAGPFGGVAPQASPSRRRIFTCRPPSPSASASARGATADRSAGQGPAKTDEERCATKILSALARRAFRRPVAADDIEMLMSFYHRERAQATFDRGIQAAIERMLVSPSFLVRVEDQPPGVGTGRAYRISDLELASRLSFFLWSSVPDEPLLAAAERGLLRDDRVLEREVRRMLGDARSDTLLTHFFGQWLTIRNVASLTPDPHAFPEFDINLREAFQRETELFLASQVREDRGVTELLTAPYTFLNERLARHYGIRGVYGAEFRRVSYPDDTRAGLLGHGSILLVTSYPNRTSVVQRGKWILENLLGTPPPPPPANVPPLEENDTKVQPKSLRERMERHRASPACAACHARMDPLGFALENFNAIGAYRTTDAGSRINPSGTFMGGTKFSTPPEFRRALLEHGDEFVETLTSKLLTYAMGRGVESYDMPAVRAIVRSAAASGFRWSALLAAIVRSTPFQMRSAE